MGKISRLVALFLTLLLIVPLTATRGAGAEATPVTLRASGQAPAAPSVSRIQICDSTGLNCVTAKGAVNSSPSGPTHELKLKSASAALALPVRAINPAKAARSNPALTCEAGESCNAAKAVRNSPANSAAPISNPAAIALPATSPHNNNPSVMICDDSGAHCVRGSSAQPPAEKLAALRAPYALPGPTKKLRRATEGEILYDKASRAEDVDPSNWSVMAYKSQHLLTVYFEGRLFARYRAVFGRSLQAGGKLYEGDRRTPEGAYRIVAKRRSYRWRYFLKLDYPNQADRLRFDELRADGMIPARFREGGEIGIHGTDEPLLNEGLINWTTGCISVDNDAIAELDRLLPIGTLVVIKP
jgi:lipoprotein-anchoring transpeptidase ErfK/SrfK